MPYAKDALNKAGSVFMEPVMKLEVECSDDHWGNVTGDLMKRRAQIKGDRQSREVKDRPLLMHLWLKMFGLLRECALRSLTRGVHHSLWNLRSCTVPRAASPIRSSAPVRDFVAKDLLVRLGL